MQLVETQKTEPFFVTLPAFIHTFINEFLLFVKCILSIGSVVI